MAGSVSVVIRDSATDSDWGVQKNKAMDDNGIEGAIE